MTVSCCFFFFFQAEDGIRDLIVTGVQTCALPISNCLFVIDDENGSLLGCHGGKDATLAQQEIASILREPLPDHPLYPASRRYAPRSRAPRVTSWHLERRWAVIGEERF